MDTYPNRHFTGHWPDSIMTPETRIKIAESLDIRQFYLMKRGLYYRPNGHGYTACRNEAWVLSEEEADKHVYPHDEPVTKHPVPTPEFDTDANAALQLVDALAKDGWEVQILGPRGDWQCTFYHTAAPNWFEWIDAHSKSAPTLPEAICAAYCKVKGIA